MQRLLYGPKSVVFFPRYNFLRPSCYSIYLALIEHSHYEPVNFSVAAR